MPIVVAVRPGHRNVSGLVHASALAAALGERVVAAAVVVVPPGVPSPLREGMVDDDYFALVAVDAFDEARRVLGEALTETLAVGARSVRAGLLDVLGRDDATHLVLGSADRGEPGRTRLGDVASALLHSAGVPVHLAPVAAPGPRRANRTTPGSSAATSARAAEASPAVSVVEPAAIRRISVAFGSGDGSRQALEQGAQLADRIDGLLRVVSCFVQEQGTASLLATQGYGSQLATAWHEQTRATVDEAIRGLSSLGLPSRFVSAEIGDGASWREALDAFAWQPGDLLVVGSRPRGGPIRTFVGSRSAEILRESPVPVMVLPG